MSLEKTDSENPVIEVVEEPAISVPQNLFLNDCFSIPLADLVKEVSTYLPKVNLSQSRDQLLFKLASILLKNGCSVEIEGIVEINRRDGHGMLRNESENFRYCPYDSFISLDLLKKYDIRFGQKLRALLSPSPHQGRYLQVAEILSVEGENTETYQSPSHFDDLVSIFPDKRIILDDVEDAGPRVIDLVAPLGKGQRGLIVAPPRGGKTVLLKQIAKSIHQKSPEAQLLILLLDERPEEVTSFEEEVDALVFSSTFDEPAKRHSQVADIVLERAKRLVERGEEVILLLDSLTRLARGYNSAQKGGAIGTGGMNPVALQRARKFFSSARNLESDASLTILATVLVETESKMDDVIFEELKGTGNMEVKLDRELAERRFFPAVHIPESGTRNDDKLYHSDEFEKVLVLRRQLTRFQSQEALEILLKAIQKSSTNSELLMKGTLNL